MRRAERPDHEQARMRECERGGEARTREGRRGTNALSLGCARGMHFSGHGCEERNARPGMGGEGGEARTSTRLKKEGVSSSLNSRPADITPLSHHASHHITPHISRPAGITLL